MEESKKASNFWFNLVEVSAIIRLILAPFIFFAPVLITILSTLADGFDGELYKRAGYVRPRYSIYDKILDYYWYVFVLAYVVVADVPFKWVFVGLFIYRTVGQLLFLLSKNGFFLFLFPNIFEKFFFYYLLTLVIPNSSFLLTPPTVQIAFFLIAAASFILEIVLHLKKMNFSGVYLGKTSFWPKVNLTNYKAFVVFSLILVLAVSLTYFQKSTNVYKNQASQAEKVGRVVYYDQAGSLIGWTSGLPTKVKILLFNNASFAKVICEQEINLLTQEGEERQVFTFKADCLLNLPDQKYFLLLTSSQKTQSRLIEFTLEQGGIK